MWLRSLFSGRFKIGLAYELDEVILSRPRDAGVGLRNKPTKGFAISGCTAQRGRLNPNQAGDIGWVILIDELNDLDGCQITGNGRFLVRTGRNLYNSLHFGS
jgi:hypothetical protein